MYKEKRGRLARAPEFPFVAREVVLAQVVHHALVGLARGDRIGEVVVGRGVVQVVEVLIGHFGDDNADFVEVLHGGLSFRFCPFDVLIIHLFARYVKNHFICLTQS